MGGSEDYGRSVDRPLKAVEDKRHKPDSDNTQQKTRKWQPDDEQDQQGIRLDTSWSTSQTELASNSFHFANTARCRLTRRAQVRNIELAGICD
jgi:hypothetical protein